MISLNCIFSFQSTVGGSFLYSSMSRRCSRQQPLLLNSVPQQREGSVHTNWQIVGKLLFLSYTNNRTLTLPPIHGNHLHKSSIENDTRYSIDAGGGLVGRGQMNYTYLYTLLWNKPKREFQKKLVNSSTYHQYMMKNIQKKYLGTYYSLKRLQF